LIASVSGTVYGTVMLFANFGENLQVVISEMGLLRGTVDNLGTIDTIDWLLSLDILAELLC
jgi:hypothetical protein